MVAAELEIAARRAASPGRIARFALQPSGLLQRVSADHESVSRALWNTYDWLWYDDAFVRKEMLRGCAEIE